jgi:hypothetical protein
MLGWFRDPASRDSRRNELGGVRVEAAQLLERDLTIQVRLPGGVYDCHAAATDLAQDLIATDRAHASKVRRAGAADNR